MKYILIYLLLFLSPALYAQKKPLPADCPDMQQKLLLIKKSFANLQQFKGELVPGSSYRYTTSLTLCNVTGEIELFEDDGGALLTFKFEGTKFADSDGKLTTAFVSNFRKSVEVVFGNTYEERYGKEDDELWGENEYYDYRPYATLYPQIRIDFPFSDDFFWIRFEYATE